MTDPLPGFGPRAPVREGHRMASNSFLAVPACNYFLLHSKHAIQTFAKTSCVFAVATLQILRAHRRSSIHVGCCFPQGFVSLGETY